MCSESLQTDVSFLASVSLLYEYIRSLRCVAAVVTSFLIYLCCWPFPSFFFFLHFSLISPSDGPLLSCSIPHFLRPCFLCRQSSSFILGDHVARPPLLFAHYASIDSSVFLLNISFPDMPPGTDCPYPIRILAFFEMIRPYHVVIRIWGKLLKNDLWICVAKQNSFILETTSFFR